MAAACPAEDRRQGSWPGVRGPGQVHSRARRQKQLRGPACPCGRSRRRPSPPPLEVLLDLLSLWSFQKQQDSERRSRSGSPTAAPPPAGGAEADGGDGEERPEKRAGRERQARPLGARTCSRQCVKQHSIHSYGAKPHTHTHTHTQSHFD